MSSLFNQTNLSPGTSFGGGANSSNFPIGININSTNPLTSYSATEGGAGGLLAGTFSAVAPLTASELDFGQTQFGVGAYCLSKWNQTGLTTQGNTTSVFYSNVIQFNSQVGGSQNDTLSYFRVSTIGTAIGTGTTNYQINMNALASTLKSVYPACVS